MEVFFEVILVASLNIHTAKWDSLFLSERVSNYLSVIFIALVCILPVGSIYLACKKPKNWRKQEFIDKYGTILEGTSLKKQGLGERSLLAVPILFFMRRVAFVIIVLVFKETLWA